MQVQLEKAKATANFTRYRGEKSGGHYESYFMRGNDGVTSRAFWIRYTLFQPHSKNNLKAAMAELWAIYFEKGKPPVAAKSEFPINSATYSNSNFSFNIGDASLDTNTLHGASGNLGDNKIEWDLRMKPLADAKNVQPIFPMPLSSYDAPLPRAKVLVTQPYIAFTGSLHINGKKISIDDWQGSQNHNWGSQHTDEYAWGQVAGFDDEPDSFLEVASAKLKFGPIMTPYLTPIYLRHHGRDYTLNTYWQALRNKANVDYFDWSFSGENAELKFEGRIHAERADFVALNYYNPPGGIKTCLNSKIAACELTLVEKGRIGITIKLKTVNRAAFEILTSKTDHGFTALF